MTAPHPGQGALTHGDRRATESRDLSKYNFENKVPREGGGQEKRGSGCLNPASDPASPLSMAPEPSAAFSPPS